MPIHPAIINGGKTLSGPAADGTANQVMTTDGSGNLTFVTLAASFVSIADAAGYFDATDVEGATQEIGQELLVHKLNGFEDATKVALSDDSGDPPTLTLTFTGEVFWWSDGVRYSDTGTDAIQISDVSGTHVIYYDGGALTSIANPTHAQVDGVIRAKAIVSWIYFNANDGSATYKAVETHGCRMSGETHHWIHDIVKAAYREGGTLSGYTLGVASDVAISFDVTDIVFYDEDIEVEITNGSAAVQYEQVLTGDAEIPVAYKDAVDQSWVEQAASTLPYLIGSTPRIQYMDKDNNYARTEVTNNDFCSYWLVATNDWQYPVKMIPGNQQYTTANDANTNAPDEILELENLPEQEYIVLYQFVMRDGSGGTTNARIYSITDYRGNRLTGSAAGSATSHIALTDLNSDLYHHLTLVEYTDLTDAGDSALHYHATDRARANHTGTQTASTISDFDTEVENNTDVDANTTARHDESHTVASHSDTTATGTELNTMTDGDDASSLHVHEKVVQVKCVADDEELTTGDGKAHWTVPIELNGWNLTNADATVYTVSSSGLPEFQIHNLSQTADMLSTEITIDASEYTSYTATTPPVIDTDEDDVTTGDRIRFDCDTAGTDTEGMEIIMTFTKP